MQRGRLKFLINSIVISVFSIVLMTSYKFIEKSLFCEYSSEYLTLKLFSNGEYLFTYDSSQHESGTDIIYEGRYFISDDSSRLTLFPKNYLTENLYCLSTINRKLKFGKNKIKIKNSDNFDLWVYENGNWINLAKDTVINYHKTLMFYSNLFGSKFITLDTNVSILKVTKGDNCCNYGCRELKSFPQRDVICIIFKDTLTFSNGGIIYLLNKRK